MKHVSRWNTPQGVMLLVFTMYLCKVVAKLSTGSEINSPMITGDGWHNLADLLEVVLIAVAIRMSRKPPDGDYPFGRKNVESVARAVIGLGLLLAAVRFVGASAAGLLSYAPELDASARNALPFLPRHEPLVLSGAAAPWVLSLTAVSAALSFAISRHEIRVGRAHGHPSMVADGEETRSDGMIESAILVGVVSEYVFHAPALEYVFGLGVAFLISRTGLELLLGGWGGLLQKSLGGEVEGALEKECLAMPGILGVKEMKTFAVGSRAVCLIDLLSDAPSVAHADLKEALKKRLSVRLAELEHDSAEFHLRFSQTFAEPHRTAYAVVSDGTSHAVAPHSGAATHILVCDMERGRAVRWSLEPLPPGGPEGLLAWLEGKRVTTLFVFGSGRTETRGRIVIDHVPSFRLSALGLTEP